MTPVAKSIGEKRNKITLDAGGNDDRDAVWPTAHCGRLYGQRLKRVRFEKGNDEGYKERWLQKLVSRYPSLLPIEQIEPALMPAISICMELPLASGFADNLYATPMPAR